MNVCKSLLRVATQKNPNRMPEWEQRLRRSRTRDEGKPSGFSLIYLPSVVLAAGFTPAATMYERLQIVASSGYSEKSDRIPEWEQRLRRSRTRDEGKPSGFPSYISTCA